MKRKLRQHKLAGALYVNRPSRISPVRALDKYKYVMHVVYAGCNKKRNGSALERQLFGFRMHTHGSVHSTRIFRGTCRATIISARSSEFKEPFFIDQRVCECGVHWRTMLKFVPCWCRQGIFDQFGTQWMRNDHQSDSNLLWEEAFLENSHKFSFLLGVAAEINDPIGKGTMPQHTSTCTRNFSSESTQNINTNSTSII